MKWALPPVFGDRLRGGLTQLVDDDEARLQHGPVSSEQAREMQRKRILDAMVSEIGERGLRGVTIAGVSARAENLVLEPDLWWLIARLNQDEVEPGTSPSAVMVNGTPEIFFSDKNDNGEISYWTWNATESWHLVRLFQDEVEPGTSPSTVVVNGTPSVFFSDKNDNGELSDWTDNASEGWHLKRLYWDQLATGTSPSAIE